MSGLRVDGAEAAVDRERLDRGSWRFPPLGRHHLVGVAGVDVLDGALDRPTEAIGDRGWRRTRAARTCRRPPGARGRPGLPDLGDRGRRLFIRPLEVGGIPLRSEDVGQDRHLVAQVVEGQQDVGDHQRQVGMPASSGFGSPTVGSALRARSYPNRPTAPPANGGSPSSGAIPYQEELLRDMGVEVRVVAQVHPHDRARAKAEERTAPETLALLGGLEQKGRPAAAQLEIGGDRVSQSAMNVWRSGTRLWARASSRTSSRPGAEVDGQRRRPLRAS